MRSAEVAKLSSSFGVLGVLGVLGALGVLCVQEKSDARSHLRFCLWFDLYSVELKLRQSSVSVFCNVPIAAGAARWNKHQFTKQGALGFRPTSNTWAVLGCWFAASCVT